MSSHSRSSRRRLAARGMAVALLAGLVLGLVSVADAGPRDRVDRDRALVELGRRLFFDPAVSRSGLNSCASCHDPDHGFSDPDRLSLDDLGLTRRHSQTLIDSHLNPNAHWDGEFRTIAELTAARLKPFGSKKGSRSRGHGLAVPVTPAATSSAPEGGTLPESPVEVTDDEDDDDGGGGGGGTYDGDAASAPDAREEKTESGAPAPSGEGADSNGTSGTSPPDCGCGTDDVNQPENATTAPESGEPTEADADAQPTPDTPAQADDAGASPRDETPWDNNGEQTELPTEDEVRKRFDPTRLPRVADVVARAGRYKTLFRAAFGSERVTTRKLAQAIEAYCHSLESTEAPIDRYLAGDASALTTSAKRGLELFRGRAGCVECHTMEGKRPTFTDFQFHNTGVTLHDLTSAHGRGGATRHRLIPDEGRAERSKRPSDVRTFKTPTLRDLTRRGPYMHSGRFETLHDVVRYYVDGGGPDPKRDARVREGLELSDTEVDDLVAFLESLTGDERPGLATQPLPLRATETRLRFVDAKGRALEGFAVRLVPVGDVLPAEAKATSTEQVLTTDAKGWIRFQPSNRTHVRVVLPDGLPLTDGALIPDTCAKAVVRVPVNGRVALLVTSSSKMRAPDTVVAEHLWGNRIPGHPAPRTLLEATRRVAIGGVAVVRYEGWMRTDVEPRIVLRVPGDGNRRQAPTLVLDTSKELRLHLRR